MVTRTYAVEFGYVCITVHELVIFLYFENIPPSPDWSMSAFDLVDVPSDINGFLSSLADDLLFKPTEEGMLVFTQQCGDFVNQCSVIARISIYL